MIRSALWALLALIALPRALYAWGPATHIVLGEWVLASLTLLPAAIREVVGRFPIHFLYGSVAADISFAKKYVPEGRHSHHWPVGEEIVEAADTEALLATAYGYLAHLAADTIAHNVFVPRQLLLTSTTQSIGHAYWEHRMDIEVGNGYMARARRLVLDFDHTEEDALFDSVLSSTIFSFRTNRRIFEGMIRFQGNDRWLQVFGKMLESSRFDIDDDEVRRYLERSFDYVIDYLTERHSSRPAALDPVGEINLRLAKKVRRLAMADGTAMDPAALREIADDFFPYPGEPLRHTPLEEEHGEVRGILGA